MYPRVSYERTKQIGKYMINGIIIFTSDNSNTSVKLLLTLDNNGLYCKILEFIIESKVSEEVRFMIADQLVETYGLMLLPSLIKLNEKADSSDLDESSIKEVIKIKEMEKYMQDAAFNILKSSIPLLKIKET